MVLGILLVAGVVIFFRTMDKPSPFGQSITTGSQPSSPQEQTRFSTIATAPSPANTVDYGVYARYCIPNGPDINQLLAQKMPEQVPIGQPTFDKGIETTAFFIPQCNMNQPWYTGAWDAHRDTYPTACDVPQEQRGFYETVKCEGIGMCHGKQYGPDIGKEEGINAHPLDDQHTEGETVCGTTPTPHRTIGVNSQPGTACYVPYGSLVYVAFEEDNPWNGWYVAEHTNAGLQGQCSMDIFIGGWEEYADASPWITGRRPKVWVFPPNGAAPITEEVFSKAIPPSQQPIGVYSIKPSFSVNLDYDLTEYKMLQEDIVFGTTGLVARVDSCDKEGQQPLEQCVTEAVQRVNQEKLTPLTARYGVQFELVDGPCDPEENIKSDFVEQYTACLDGPDTDCACSITMKQAAQNQQSETTIVLLSGTELPPSAIGIDQFIAQMAGKTVRHLDTTPQTEEEQVTIHISSDEREKTMHFYKTIGSLAFIADENQGNKKTCSVNKRSFKFCARRLDRQHLVFDEDSNAMSVKPVEYKFALTFPDRIPAPPVTDIKLYDEPLADKSVIVQWTKSPDNDIASYDIFLAPTEHDIFMPGANTAELRLQAKTISLRVDMVETILGEINLNQCVFDMTSKECLYIVAGNTPVILEQNRLYHVITPTRDYYLTIIDNLENTPYDVGVIAVDVFGNEIDNAKTPLQITRQFTPVDNMPPAMIEGVRINIDAADPTQLVMEWNRPWQNIDGLLLEDLEGFTIYNGALGTPDISSMTEIARITPQQAGCDSLTAARCSYSIAIPDYPAIAVAAVDEAGNVFTTTAEIGEVPTFG